MGEVLAQSQWEKLGVQRAKTGVWEKIHEDVKSVAKWQLRAFTLVHAPGSPIQIKLEYNDMDLFSKSISSVPFTDFKPMPFRS